MTATEPGLGPRRRAALTPSRAAPVPLPDYPIARLSTGQFVSGQGRLWSAEIAAIDNDAKK